MKNQASPKRPKAKYVLNLFSAADYKGMLKYLNKMALNGWRLEKIGFFIKFVKAVPAPGCYVIDIHHIKKQIKHNLDVYDTRYYDSKKADGLCFIASFDDIQIFHIDDFAAVDSLHIKDADAYKMISSSLMQKRIIALVVILPFIFTTALEFANYNYSVFLQNRDFVLPIIAILLEFFTLFLLVIDVPWHIKAKKQIKNDKELPALPKGIAIFRTLFFPAVLVICLLGFGITNLMDRNINVVPFENSKVLTLAALDADVSHTDNSIPYQSNSSVFVPSSYSYMQKARDNENGEPFIYTKYFNAKNEKISNNIFKAMAKTAQSEYRIIEKAPDAKKIWHADKVYYINEDKSQLLIKKGNEVFLVKGSFDFSNPKIIELCKLKFKL